MTDEGKSFQSNLTEKQFPLMRLEMLLDELNNTLSNVESDILKGYESSLTPTLINLYLNVLGRTESLDAPAEYVLCGNEPQKQLCGIVRSYVKFLQKKGIYSLGREDFSL